ncbi:MULTISPECIES: hypothetical protein [Haloferax]|uniref:Uncharacterized protein n=1 Tax=Haloferax marinum TaxID=2666143 RepID=A0A6A8G2M8_9EURY|nr:MULTISPECIES: hypothetical protein [Haloferax]KAB1196049.1 hypothetical protein Hfx1150_00375 [Haloferax sp. CBA1150]MRW95029.1 hypothetical protein [Haloferax marinum]
MSDAASRIVETVRAFGGDALRDLWVFDRQGYEHLYIRADVADAIDTVDVAKFIDNERFGYVTRDTYEALYYADYGYTVRGFDTFEQFRTFVGDGPVGMFASFDRGSSGRDFATLNDRIQALSNEFDFSRLTTPAEALD